MATKIFVEYFEHSKFTIIFWCLKVTRQALFCTTCLRNSYGVALSLSYEARCIVIVPPEEERWQRRKSRKTICSSKKSTHHKEYVMDRGIIVFLVVFLLFSDKTLWNFIQYFWLCSGSAQYSFIMVCLSQHFMHGCPPSHYVNEFALSVCFLLKTGIHLGGCICVRVFVDFPKLR